MTTIEFYKDVAGRWRWREKAANHRIVADSGQGYRTRWGVRRAIRRQRSRHDNPDAVLVKEVPE